MKKNFFALFFIILSVFLCFAETSEEEISKEQFVIKNSKGSSFYLLMPVEEVFEILGEPLKKTNLWGSYPKASCAFYLIEYEGISFKYFDTDNLIINIWVDKNGKDYSINDISIGSKIEPVREFFKNVPSFETEKFYDEVQKKYRRFFASTEGTNLSYIKNTEPHYYVVNFYFDVKTGGCEFFYVMYPIDI